MRPALFPPVPALRLLWDSTQWSQISYLFVTKPLLQKRRPINLAGLIHTQVRKSFLAPNLCCRRGLYEGRRFPLVCGPVGRDSAVGICSNSDSQGLLVGYSKSSSPSPILSTI